MVHRYLSNAICIVFIAVLLNFSHIATAAEIPLYAKDASGFGSEGFPSSFVVPYALGERQNTEN